MNTTELQALIWDVDGTLADTEHAHLAAFNLAFKAEGMDWHWDEALYTRLLEISGGKERMRHHWKQTRGDMLDIDGTAVDDTIERLHAIKTAAYEALVQGGGVALRPGVLELLREARASGLQLAIATTTSPVNVGALLRPVLGEKWASNFAVVCDASTAPLKKPHPQVYRQVLQALQLPAQACLAFEDSANGLASASAAGIATVITPTSFTAGHDFTQALRVRGDLAGVRVADLRAWHAAHLTPA